ncbi:hypothetical protein FF38_04419, partial [Lucilia cuprina]
MEKDESSFILNLIESVEKKKCLYDKKDPFYFNRCVKEKAWKEIGEVCGRSVFNILMYVHIEIKGADCKHKWKLLRERFCKELKKMEAPSGSGMSYMEEWRFLQPMLFLKDSLSPRRTRDNAFEHDAEKDVEQFMISGDSLLEPLTSSPTPSKKCKTTLDTLCQKFGDTIESIEKSLTASLQEEETSDEAFMKAVLSLMKDLPINIKDEFQAGVMQDLYQLRKDCRNAKS